MLAVHDFHRRDSQVKHHQGHGDREYAIAEGGDTLHALARYAVVSSRHGD